MKDIWDKIFGIGLGRTGTTSLTKAIDILGFTPTLHGLKYIDQLRGCKFASDIFVAARWKFLDYAYPKAKFILTDRDTFSWIESSKRHAGSTIKHGRSGARSEYGLKLALRTAESRFIIYGTTVFEPETFIIAKEKHTNDIKKHFKHRPNKLLIMDFEKGDGWDKLCEFLEIPIPDKPFPHKHKNKVTS